MKHYLLVIRNCSAHVIGPFDTYEASCEWADANWDFKTGDPRWQTVALPDEMVSANGVTLPLHAPEHAKELI